MVFPDGWECHCSNCVFSGDRKSDLNHLGDRDPLYRLLPPPDLRHTGRTQKIRETIRGSDRYRQQMDMAHRFQATIDARNAVYGNMDLNFSLKASARYFDSCLYEKDLTQTMLEVEMEQEEMERREKHGEGLISLVTSSLEELRQALYEDSGVADIGVRLQVFFPSLVINRLATAAAQGKISTVGDLQTVMLSKDRFLFDSNFLADYKETILLCIMYEIEDWVKENPLPTITRRKVLTLEERRKKLKYGGGKTPEVIDYNNPNHLFILKVNKESDDLIRSQMTAAERKKENSRMCKAEINAEKVIFSLISNQLRAEASIVANKIKARGYTRSRTNQEKTAKSTRGGDKDEH